LTELFKNISWLSLWTTVYITRPHRSNSWERPIATDECLSVAHVREPCKNGWTDRDAVLVGDLGGPKEPCISWDCPIHWKALWVTAAVHAAKAKINNGISVTAAAYRIAPDW